MEEKRFLLADNVKAEASRNKTAIIGVTIMNMVLCAAYLLEVFKGARDIVSYLIVAATNILPCIISVIIYQKKKDSKIIRYVCGIGFLLFYLYVMVTGSTTLTFCYALVLFAILTVYVDMKFSLMLSIGSLIVNILQIVVMATSTGLSAQDVTDAEIKIACVILTSAFSLMAIKKVDLIGKANVAKADYEKEQADILLKTTLEVADSITENIGQAVMETENLNENIEMTQKSMNNLTTGTGDVMGAITNQQKSTKEIDDYIKEVSGSTEQIVGELANTDDNLKIGLQVMDELLNQVKISEDSSNVVSKEIEELRENANRMQDIVGLIKNVANKTAMLSLNASIEAARAGEAGRGFAVVAGEISDLASQTNNATTEISDLIVSITNSVSEVIKAMNGLLESNRFQNEYVNKSAQNFEKINESTKEILVQADVLKETVAAVSGANEVVVNSIDNVSSVTEEVIASADETLESCNTNMISVEKLTEIMHLLGEEAKRLKK